MTFLVINLLIGIINILLSRLNETDQDIFELMNEANEII